MLVNEAHQVVFFTIWFALECIEWLSLKRDLAMLTGKATDMIDLVHCCASRTLSHNLLATLAAHTYVTMGQLDKTDNHGSKHTIKICVWSVVHGL